MIEQGFRIVPVESVEVYKIMGSDELRKEDVMVYTKYKTMEKKVKPTTERVPANNEQKRKEFSKDLTFQKFVDIKHTFTNETWKKL